MASGTLEQNIQIIRSTGVYGTDIREAIASAIELADVSADGKINHIQDEVDNKEIRMYVSKIEGTNSDYLLTIVNPG